MSITSRPIRNDQSSVGIRPPAACFTRGERLHRHAGRGDDGGIGIGKGLSLLGDVDGE